MDDAGYRKADSSAWPSDVVDGGESKWRARKEGERGDGSRTHPATA